MEDRLNEVILGDCLEVMASMDPESVDAIVTDPPAGISFMGKAWDHDKGGRDQWIAWMTSVMVECHRVLKPGGHILVWALPRTSHWTGMAIENAGFEPRDKLIHAFASGFPKSLSVGKAIDRAAGAEREVVGHYRVGGNALTPTSEKGGTYEVGVPNTPPGDLDITAPATPEAAKWEGWGTALKPAYEDWWLARKPLIGTVAANVLEYGTGAINIDGCRIGVSVEDATAMERANTPGSGRMKTGGGLGGSNTFSRSNPTGELDTTKGRWPANVILTDPIFDGNTEGVVGGGETSSGWSDGFEGDYTAEVSGKYAHNQIRPGTVYGDSGTYSRFFMLPQSGTMCAWCGASSAELSSSQSSGPDGSAQNPAPTEASVEPITTTASPITSATEQISWHGESASMSKTRRSPESRPIAPSPSSPARSAVQNETSLGTTTTTPGRWMCASCDEDAMRFAMAEQESVERNYPWAFLIPKAARAEREPPFAWQYEKTAFIQGTGGQAALARGEEEYQDASSASNGFNVLKHRVNIHATVKPLELMRHLVRLVTPPGGICLDPFAGSGTTLLAAQQEGFDWIGIEKEEEYVAIAEARLNGAPRGLGL